MTPENENSPVEPALNGDEPSSSVEEVSVEPNGHETVEPTSEATPEPEQEASSAETPATHEAPAAAPEPEPVTEAAAPVAEPPAAEASKAEREAEPAPEMPAAPEPEPVPEAVQSEPVAAEAAAAEPASITPEPEAPVEPAAEVDEEDASSIAADIQRALAAASAASRASAEAAERAAVAADLDVAVAVAEPEAPEEAEPAAEGEEGEEPAAVARIFQPGDWFVVHTYAGYENKVKANLQSRISSMNMEEKIFEVTIPMEDVMEIKSGKKQVVQRKVFPGYLLVRMDLDDDSWYVVRNTPGVTGFVGSGTKPIPLSEREVDRILQRKAVGERPKPKLEWSLNDPVRVTTGPFANFQGLISEIDTDRSKLKVLVNIFGRETPVELGFDQVAKV